MAGLPAPLAELAAELGRLPGIGPRSAERLALHLVQAEPAAVTRLAETLTRTRTAIVHCGRCGALATASPCALCADARRDPALLCVVERPVDILAVEKAGAFRGLYHVLGGKISPLNGIGPEDLRIAALERRLREEPVKELILALGSDVEGDATSHYLAQLLAPRGVKVSRLAQGLPAGSGLDFADELTLARALEGRREMT